MAGILTLLATPAVFSQTPKFAVGASAGLAIPIVQADQAEGTVYGFRLRYQMLPSLAFEPNVYFSQYGDPTSDIIDLGIEGSKVTAYGVDVILGSRVGSVGPSSFFFAGIGYYEQTNETLEQVFEPEGKRLGYSAGLGFAMGLTPMIDIEARGRLHLVPSKGGGSTKSASILGGFNLNLGGP